MQEKFDALGKALVAYADSVAAKAIAAQAVNQAADELIAAANEAKANVS